MIPIPSEQELLEEILTDIRANTLITNLNPGSVARMLVEAINKKLYKNYLFLDQNISQTFVSVAQGSYLDMIGELLGCYRTSLTETDANYRYRITKQVFSSANANMLAIRLRSLQVNGVKDIIVHEYSNGSGSFTLYVITDEVEPPVSLLNQIRSLVTDIKAGGVVSIVKGPKLLEMSMSIYVVPNAATPLNRLVLKEYAKASIKTYLDTIPIGGTISIPDIMDGISNKIQAKDIIVNYIKLNNEYILSNINYTMEPYSRIYIDDIEVEIVDA